MAEQKLWMLGHDWSRVEGAFEEAVQRGVFPGATVVVPEAVMMS